MDDLLCALCIYATYTTSARVVYAPPDGKERVLIHERGPEFVELWQTINDGLHPDFEPAGHFEINQTTTRIRAVTMVGGTAVCPAHLVDALERIPAANGRRW